jgi:hypothetical protein
MKTAQGLWLANYRSCELKYWGQQL